MRCLASGSDTSLRSCSAPGGATPISSASSSGRSAAARRCTGRSAQAFGAIERIVAQGQRDGVFRSDLDARLLAWIFYGAIEEILTGWVLGQLPDDEDDVLQAEQTVVDVVCEGMAVR